MTLFSTRRALLPLAVAGALTTSLVSAAPALAGPAAPQPDPEVSSLAGGSTVANATTNRRVASTMVRHRGWSRTQYRCLVRLWSKESGWNHRARNASSGAYGIPQALPGSRMASAGGDWRTNPNTQIRWGLNYIAGRYGTPCRAWSHSIHTNWY